MERQNDAPDGEKSDGGKQSSRQGGNARESDGSQSRDSPTESLQSALGNQAIQRLYEDGHLQAKLSVSQPGDEDEKEAERVADQVMGMSSSDGAVDREVTGGISRKGSSDGTAVDGETEQQIKSVTSGGKSLPPATRSFFEPRFGRDFSDVRVHTGSKADEAARSIDAEAFTHGNDVVFRKGRYDPDSNEGKELLAHELTHVVQQGGGQAKRVQRQEGGDKQREGGGNDKSEKGSNWATRAVEQFIKDFKKRNKKIANSLDAMRNVNSILDEVSTLCTQGNEYLVNNINTIKKKLNEAAGSCNSFLSYDNGHFADIYMEEKNSEGSGTLWQNMHGYLYEEPAKHVPDIKGKEKKKKRIEPILSSIKSKYKKLHKQIKKAYNTFENILQNMFFAEVEGMLKIPGDGDDVSSLLDFMRNRGAPFAPKNYMTNKGTFRSSFYTAYYTHVEDLDERISTAASVQGSIPQQSGSAGRGQGTGQEGSYTVTVPAVKNMKHASSLDVLNFHESTIFSGKDGKRWMAIVDTSSGEGIYVEGSEQIESKFKKLRKILQGLGYPDPYLSHLKNQISTGSTVHIAKEYFSYLGNNIQGQGLSKRKSPSGAKKRAKKATLPSVRTMNMGSKGLTFLAMAGMNPYMAGCFYAMHKVAVSTGHTLAFGINAGASGGIGLEIGGGYAFLPSGAVGVYGAASSDFGAQLSAGIDGVFTYVFGNINTFTGSVAVYDVTLKWAVGGTGTGIFKLEGIDSEGRPIPGEFLGVSGEAGFGAGLDVFSAGVESTGILGGSE